MANEKRLIDAESIARKLKKANCVECNVVRKVQCSACWVNDVLELLDDDSVDAVEVVHAEYVWVDDEECGIYRCSFCNGAGGYPTNYCPNCGAKMDGGNEDAVN